jgi:hypothetical protein
MIHCVFLGVHRISFYVDSFELRASCSPPLRSVMHAARPCLCLHPLTCIHAHARNPPALVCLHVGVVLQRSVLFAKEKQTGGDEAAKSHTATIAKKTKWKRAGKRDADLRVLG